MPMYAPEPCAGLLLRMGFVETARNDYWRYRYPGLGFRTFVSFGNGEVDADLMGRIITGQLRMTVDEFRAATDGDIPERFTNPRLWEN